MGLKCQLILFYLFSPVFAQANLDLTGALESDSEKEVYFFSQENPKNKPSLPILILPHGLSQDVNTQEVIEKIKALLNNTNQSIQINVIENAHFHLKQNSNRTPSSQIAISKDNVSVGSESIFLTPDISFSRLDAKDINNGGSATALSNQNIGLTGGFNRRVSETSELIFYFGGNVQNFGSNFNASSSLYLKAGGGYKFDVDKFFDILGRVGLKQLPYLDSLGGSAVVNNVTHPSLGAELTLKMAPVLKIDLKATVFSEFLNNSIAGNTPGKSGVNFGINSCYDFQLNKYPIQIKAYYQRYSLESRSTTQSINEVGLASGILFPL